MAPETILLLQNMQADIRGIKSDIHEDMKEIKKDVKDLQGFKWKVAGMASATTAIVGILLKIMFH